MEKELLYKGKELKEYSKEQLIEIIIFLNSKNKEILQQKKHEREFLTSIKF